MHVKTKVASYTVWVCQDHEEHASPKRIRELIEKRESDIAEFEAKARALGYTLTPVAGGIITAFKTDTSTDNINKSSDVSTIQQQQLQDDNKTQQSEPKYNQQSQPQSQQQPQQQPQQKNLDPRYRMATRKVRDIEAPTSAVDPAGRSITLERHQSYNATEVILKDGTRIDAPKERVEEAQIVPGRGGVPISIPKKVVGDAGVTDIMIVDTGGDRVIQNIFRDIARNSVNNYGPDFRSGYIVRDCTLCSGTGISRISKDACPKCKGAGTI
ncbi:MAG: hypothetical protein QXP41_00580 [Candidatus Nitrosocaldus sp.]